MTVTDRDLANAVFELSVYVSSLPPREEAKAVKDEAIKIFSEWIHEQDLSIEKKVELYGFVVADGRISAAAEQGRKQWLNRRSS